MDFCLTHRGRSSFWDSGHGLTLPLNDELFLNREICRTAHTLESKVSNSVSHARVSPAPSRWGLFDFKKKWMNLFFECEIKTWGPVWIIIHLSFGFFSQGSHGLISAMASASVGTWRSLGSGVWRKIQRGEHQEEEQATSTQCHYTKWQM